MLRSLPLAQAVWLQLSGSSRRFLFRDLCGWQVRRGEMQGGIDGVQMQVALGEGNDDAFFGESAMDRFMQFVRDGQPVLHQRQIQPQGQIQCAVTEHVKGHGGSGIIQHERVILGQAQ